MDKSTFEMLHTPMDAPIQYEKRRRKLEHEKAMKELTEWLEKLKEIPKDDDSTPIE